MEIDDLPSFLKPRLRIFLSADLVGSSKLKQAVRSADDGVDKNLSDGWLNTLNRFYRLVETTFSAEWNSLKTTLAKDGALDLGSDPELWKANGDELIFVKVLTNVIEAQAVVHCWLEAVRRTRSELMRKEFSGVDVKATAWTAGFPVRNREIIFQTASASEIPEPDIGAPTYASNTLLNAWYEGGAAKKGLIRDFVGPSLDAGFRLASLASPRKFILSVELAYILSSLQGTEVAKSPKKTIGKFRFRYDGRVHLKGILGGKPYPVFHIDALYDDELLKVEDVIRNERKITRDEVSEFCNAFIGENDGFLTRPFVFGCPNPSFSEKWMPEYYEAELGRRSTEWQQTKIKLKTEIDALSDMPGPASDELEVPADEIQDFTQTALRLKGESALPEKAAASLRPKSKRKTKPHRKK